MAAEKGRGNLIIEPVGMAELNPYTVRVGEQATLGRGEACEVRIDDRQVSKAHARITFDAGAWYVTDLGSRVLYGPDPGLLRGERPGVHPYIPLVEGASRGW